MINNLPSFVATTQIAVRRFVKITGDFQVGICAAGDVAFGVSGLGARDTPIPNGSANAAEIGDSVRVYGLGECVPMPVGAAITAGQFVKPDAQGRPTPCSAADKYSGQAIQSQATVGADCEIFLCRGVA